MLPCITQKTAYSTEYWDMTWYNAFVIDSSSMSQCAIGSGDGMAIRMQLGAPNRVTYSAYEVTYPVKWNHMLVKGGRGVHNITS